MSRFRRSSGRRRFGASRRGRARRIHSYHSSRGGIRL